MVDIHANAVSDAPTHGLHLHYRTDRSRKIRCASWRHVINSHVVLWSRSVILGGGASMHFYNHTLGFYNSAHGSSCQVPLKKLHVQGDHP
ncbi:hypothetical protein ABKN59_006721 [Abortiporus biennis]